MILESTAQAIWGEPLAEFSDIQPEIYRGQLQGQPSVAAQLRFFVNSQIEEWAPDVILVHERKGTAILRALIEAPSNPLVWSWDRTVSSTALDQLPEDFFQGKRILVFDDMIRTGKALHPLFEHLNRLNCLSRDLVRLAIFAAHQDSSLNGALKSHGLSVAWFYRDLSTPAYRRLRTQLLQYLQVSGSLMLDTEHIEVRIKLHTGMGRLLSALRRKADAIVFQSAALRTNITVFYPDDEAHSLPKDRFPEGCAQTAIVKKCRVVQRDADEFAIIPICLPSVPVTGLMWPAAVRDRNLLGESVGRSHRARFYGAALVASLYPLQWVLRDLYAADPRMVTVSLPNRSGNGLSSAGYSLNHLRVMYPTLDADILANVIAEIDATAQSEGGKLRSRKFDIAPYKPVSDAQLRKDAMRLLQVIAHSVDQKHALELLYDPTCERRVGLRPAEIFALGDRLNFDRPYVSALFDILIDDGSVVTRVDELIDDEGCKRLERTFKPDGEAVSDLVRHFTVQWGLPSGF